MRLMQHVRTVTMIMVLAALVLTACSSANNQRQPYAKPPINEEQAPAQPELNPSLNQDIFPNNTAPQNKEIKVVYTYGDTDAVQLSTNKLTLKVGQALLLEPGPTVKKSTRFMAYADDSNFYSIMDNDTTRSHHNRPVYIAKKPGHGKLQIVPNYSDFNRAADLWITVEQ